MIVREDTIGWWVLDSINSNEPEADIGAVFNNPSTITVALDSGEKFKIVVQAIDDEEYKVLQPF